MAYDPLLSTTRDRLRFILGDTDDPPGFSHLGKGGPLLPDLSEASYDSAIAVYGPQKAGYIITTRVRQMFAGTYKDGDVSEDLRSIVDALTETGQKLLDNEIIVGGQATNAPVHAALVPMTNPDMETFEQL